MKGLNSADRLDDNRRMAHNIRHSPNIRYKQHHASYRYSLSIIRHTSIGIYDIINYGFISLTSFHYSPLDFIDFVTLSMSVRLPEDDTKRDVKAGAEPRMVCII